MASKPTVTQTLRLLLQPMHLADAAEMQTYEHLRDVGRRWIKLKIVLGEEDIKIKPFAKEQLPRGCSYSWLERHADLYRRWDQFVEDKKWADSHFNDESRPGLSRAFQIMDAKRRFDMRSKSCQKDLGVNPEHHAAPGVSRPSAAKIAAEERLQRSLPANDVSLPIQVTPTSTILQGDAAEMMRRHVRTGEADLVLADSPYFLRTPEDGTVIDYYLDLNDMKPRMREEWDRFASIQEYEEFCSGWIDEGMRCLHQEGSMFICGMWQNIGIINRLLQIKNISIIGEIVWVKRNSRPCISRRRLQMSHEHILWVAKNVKQYRFNYRSCKSSDYAGDYFSERGKQMRDVWDIPCAAGHVGNGHPTPKPIALFERILDVAGSPGGKMLDLFSGGGTGAVAALRWGMSSVSIERDHRYVDLIRANITKEVTAMNLREAAD